MRGYLTGSAVALAVFRITVFSVVLLSRDVYEAPAWAATSDLTAVGDVETVAVSAETVTITLAPNAVAMSAGDGRGDGHVTGELTGGASDIHVDKVVNSNMPHAAERAVERAGFSSVQDARAALQEFGRQIEKSGLPPGTIRDTAHADRVIVPGFGRGGAVVYQFCSGGHNGADRFKEEAQALRAASLRRRSGRGLFAPPESPR